MTTPWTHLYPANVAATLVPDFEDMVSMFRARVAAARDAPALCYFDRVVSYGALDSRSDAAAAWLLAQGVAPGDRVAIIAQNIPAFPTMCLAAWKIGAIPVPVNPMYRAVELARILADAAPSAILCQEADLAELLSALATAGLQDLPVVTCSPHDDKGAGGDGADLLPPATGGQGRPSLRALEIAHDGASPPCVARLADDIALILDTSGTTGLPKGAMLSHRALCFNARFVRDWCSLDTQSTIFGMAPLFHITGFVCHVCTAFSAGCALIINYRFDAHLALAMIRRWRPSFTVGAITAFNALARLPGIAPADMASFRLLYSGGAPIAPALKAEIELRLGQAIHPCFGMTETAAPAVFTPPGRLAPVRDGVLSIGVPIPSTDIRIVGEDGAPVATGAAGEILIRGPQVMNGYWRKPDDTAAALTDGWVQSGDIGFMDTQGWLFLVDRKKDVIIASGFKVWPREVEDALYAHDSVREAAVVGVADSYRGETVKAFVSLRPDRIADPATLIDHCRQRLAAYKVPRAIEILPDLPKTVSGKIQRAALRA